MYPVRLFSEVPCFLMCAYSTEITYYVSVYMTGEMQVKGVMLKISTIISVSIVPSRSLQSESINKEPAVGCHITDVKKCPSQRSTVSRNLRPTEDGNIQPKYKCKSWRGPVRPERQERPVRHSWEKITSAG